MKEKYILWFVCIVNLVLVLVLTQKVLYPTQDDLKKTYYDTQTATLVSPHSLRELIEYGQSPYLLVDLRERNDYLRSHIVGAINVVPSENLVEDFKKLQVENPYKTILTYCYTEVCMRGREVGRDLAAGGVFVRELGIGYNEWEHFWTKWNYENEWEHINIQDYMQGSKTDKTSPKSETRCARYTAHTLRGQLLGNCTPCRS